jgi:hypothetical protein
MSTLTFVLAEIGVGIPTLVCGFLYLSKWSRR